MRHETIDLKNLKIIREHRKLTRANLAGMIDITQQVIGGYERRIGDKPYRKASKGYALKICKALQCTLDELAETTFYIKVGDLYMHKDGLKRGKFKAWKYTQKEVNLIRNYQPNIKTEKVTYG